MNTDIRLRLRGPIERLDWLHQSLLFAELSALAYREEPIAREAAQQYGFHDVRFLDKEGAQAYVFSNDHDCVVAFRGTEPREWNDIRADLNAVTDLAETVGRVHRGFKQEVDTLWPDLESSLTDESKANWLTGHSLGGAMATISRRAVPGSPGNPTARRVVHFRQSARRQQAVHQRHCFGALPLGEQQRHRHACSTHVARLPPLRPGSVFESRRPGPRCGRVAEDARPVARVPGALRAVEDRPVSRPRHSPIHRIHSRGGDRERDRDRRPRRHPDDAQAPTGRRDATAACRGTARSDETAASIREFGPAKGRLIPRPVRGWARTAVRTGCPLAGQATGRQSGRW